MKRTLSLKREQLAELSTAELTDVVGAAALPTTPVNECTNSAWVCLSRGVTCTCS